MEEFYQNYSLYENMFADQSSSKIMVTTLGMANNAKFIHCYFNPECLVVEEALLVLLHDFINLLKHHGNGASKVIIAGDRHQLQAEVMLPTLLSLFA